MISFQKVNAPECPKCGCNHAEMVGAGDRPRPWARFQCDHCQHVFFLGTQPSESGTVNGVVYQPVQCRCPKCKSINPPVTSTQGRIRYHKCDKCGQRFKSVEAKR